MALTSIFISLMVGFSLRVTHGIIGSSAASSVSLPGSGSMFRTRADAAFLLHFLGVAPVLRSWARLANSISWLDRALVLIVVVGEPRLVARALLQDPFVGPAGAFALLLNCLRLGLGRLHEFLDKDAMIFSALRTDKSASRGLTTGVARARVC